MAKGFVVGCAAFIVAGAAAAAQDDVRLDGANLSVDFDQPMLVWAARPPSVRAEPALTFQCNWSDDTRLECNSDTARARPASRYRIFLPDMARQDGTTEPARVVDIETARPELSRSYETRWEAGRPIIAVDANQNVSLEAVERILRLSIDGRPVRPIVRPKGDRRFEVSVPATLPRQPDAALRLEVAPGLVSEEGPLPGTQFERLFGAAIDTTPRLVRLDCGGIKHERAQFAEPLVCNPSTGAAMTFNEELDVASHDRLVAKLPAGIRAHGWSRTWNGGDTPQGDALRLEFDSARASWTIEVPDGLHAVDGSPVSPDHVVIETGDWPPLLRAAGAKHLLADPRASLGISVINAPVDALPVDMLGLGAGAVSSRIALPTGPLNTPVELDDAATRAVLEQGGWVRWALSRRAGGTELAAPQINVSAVAGHGEVIVWVRDWRGADVEGARVELVPLTDRPTGLTADVVASGKSDVHGIADVALQDPFGADAGLQTARWLLRVTTSGATPQRAVLPLQSWWDGGSLMLQTRDLEWGVTDRPLYHPGDVVHFRLWTGETLGARRRLSSHDALLRLKAAFEDDKVLLTWPAVTIGTGLAGDVRIPTEATDGYYCIGTASHERYAGDGACFSVGAYRALDLWAEAKSNLSSAPVREGDRFVFDVDAGFYSGGAAVGIPLSRPNAMITGVGFEDAYPEFAGFHFASSNTDGGRDGVRLRPPTTLPVTDANGHARVALPVQVDREDEKLPAFGRVQATVEVRPSGRESVSTNAASVWFAREKRYVGIRLVPAYFDTATPVRVETVLADAMGHPLPPGDVAITVDYLPRWDDDAGAQHVGGCRVRSGSPQRCDFPHTRAGRYRLTAHGTDAADSVIDRYVWNSSGSTVDEPPPPAPAAQASVTPDRKISLHLANLKPGAEVLVVLSQDASLLGHARAKAVQSELQLTLASPPDISGKVVAHVFVMPPPSDDDAAGHRAPMPLTTSASVDLGRPLPDHAISILFSTQRTAPGSKARLRIHNAGDTTREVTVSVVDDAVRSLGSAWLDDSDPYKAPWQAGAGRYSEDLPLSSFADWNDEHTSFELPRRMPKPMPKRSTNLARGNGLVSAPAAAPGGSTQELGRVEVTGSRIRAVDSFNQGPGHVEGVQSVMALDRRIAEAADPDPAVTDRTPKDDSPRPRHEHGARRDAFAIGRIAMARLRTRFLDTALWLPAVQLAAGETRDVDVPLPDNLTRWRAVAWSTDGDRFDMTDAVLEVGLEVEARVQAPVRLYPGDRSRISGNARHATARPARAQVQVSATGAGLQAVSTSHPLLAASGDAGFELDIAPTVAGAVDVTAAAATAAGSDAVAARIDVESPRIPARRVQAGWLPPGGVVLTVPALPAGATEPQLSVDIERGGGALIDHWTQELRDYPHRCWEQMLSRAVAAAHALRRSDQAWPDAAAVVREALDNVAVFQDSDGGFHYFAEQASSEPGSPRREVALTSYTILALRHLASLGHPVRQDVVDAAAAFLAEGEMPATADDLNEAALAEGADMKPALNAAVWARWAELKLPAQVAFARRLAASNDAHAEEAIDRLVQAAPLRAGRRAFAGVGDWPRWMASPMREQCRFIDLLSKRPDRADVYRAMVAGMADLYAGGVVDVDTQTGAQCLIALDSVDGDRTSEIAVNVSADGRASQVLLGSGQPRGRWDGPQGAVPATLKLATETAPPAMPSYLVQLNYVEDARYAQSSAVGLAIERRYELLRDGRWNAVTPRSLHVGDWVRVTLRLRTGAPRYFVALTDPAPGGLMPTDLSLNGVAGVDVRAAADPGSYWFATRRLDPRISRFYATYLPAGSHEVHYFARVGNSGNYLAAPATAELMYGEASRARTSAARIDVLPDASAR